MSAPQPAEPPQRVVLAGRTVRLEPLGPEHATALFEASSTADIDEKFRYLFDVPPASREALRDWIATGAEKSDPMFFAAVVPETGVAIGRQALMRIVPEHGVIEVGSIYWGPQMARTVRATEALFLHASYVFDTLGYRRFEWKCDNRNEPSKRAALRFGFTFEGVFRQHMIVKGQSRDTAWFAMLDGDWPRIKAEYERWLDPANFDADGAQRTSLRVNQG